MKLASFDGGKIGLVEGERIIELPEWSQDAASWPPVGMVQLIAACVDDPGLLAGAVRGGAERRLSEVRLEAPIQWPNKLIAFPANYHEHVEEMKRGTGLISPFKADGQGFFLKANSSLSGPNDPIVLPDLPERQIHHECEIAIIIGRGGRWIARENALDHIFGYCALIDMVVRGREERVMRKSFDSFCPLGPYITTRDEVPDPSNMRMYLNVNGQRRQTASTADLIVGIPQMIEMASSVMTLFPGDIIATGTPQGVGPVSGGDVVEIVVEGVGAMTLNVVQGGGATNGVWKKAQDKDVAAAGA
mgnify:FL=1